MIAQRRDVVEACDAQIARHQQILLAPCGDGADRHEPGDGEYAHHGGGRSRLHAQCRGQPLRGVVPAVAAEVTDHLQQRGQASSAQCLDEAVAAVHRRADARRTADDREPAMAGLEQSVSQFCCRGLIFRLHCTAHRQLLAHHHDSAPTGVVAVELRFQIVVQAAALPRAHQQNGIGSMGDQGAHRCASMSKSRSVLANSTCSPAARAAICTPRAIEEKYGSAGRRACQRLRLGVR